MKQKRLSQEEVEKIHEMKEEGKTNTEIAKELEVEEGAIRHHIRKNDNCHICSEPDSPSNIIPSPVSFQKQEPVNDYPMLSFDKFLRGSSPHLSNLDR